MTAISWVLTVLLWWATGTHMQSGASYRWLTLAATVGMTWLLWQQGRDHYVEEEPLEPEPQNG